jgi:hypothetical protein
MLVVYTFLEIFCVHPHHHLTFNPPGSQPGEHYRSVYQSAVLQAPPEQRLHLCHLNHLAFALLTGFRQAYLADLTWVNAQVKSASVLPARRSTLATFPLTLRRYLIGASHFAKRSGVRRTWLASGNASHLHNGLCPEICCQLSHLRL